MDTLALREIARAIAEEQFLLHWPFYVSMFVLSGVVGFASAFVGAYAKKRGENYATKADFDGLLTQLKLTTSVAEEVKSQVSHADWVTREAKLLRRTKLEELLHAIHEVQAWVETDRAHRLFNSPSQPGNYPMPKVEVLSGLYFPELSQLVFEFGQLHRQSIIMIIKAHSECNVAHQNHQKQLKILDKFNTDWAPLYQSQLKVISAVEKEAREIMAALVGA